MNIGLLVKAKFHLCLRYFGGGGWNSILIHVNTQRSIEYVSQ